MPTYEYRCDACKRQMEIEQRITEDRLTKCPKCGKKKLVRLIGTGNFILKGSGWGKDLYSSAPPKSAKKDDSGSGESKSDSAASESKGESTGESKSDAKSESKNDSGKSDSKSDSGKSDAKKSKADKPAKK